MLIVNRANWARSKTVAESLVELGIEVVVFSASSMNLEKYGEAVNGIDAARGIKVIKLMSNVDGTTLETQALSTGLLVTLLTPQLKSEIIDGLIVIADRYEIIAGAIASSYMNIPLIHIQGGEISGNIDNKVRFATSFLSDLHFPCSDLAYKRLSEIIPSSNIYNFGCPAMDLAMRYSDRDINKILSVTPHIGLNFDIQAPYFLVTLHPDTERYYQMTEDAEIFYSVVDEISKNIRAVVVWPNVDGGSDKISKVIRKYRENGKLSNCGFYKNFESDDYPSVVKNASFCLGNSSSFLREAVHFGTPAVIVGGRQSGRDIFSNAVFSSYDRESIHDSIDKVRNCVIEPEWPYGEGNAGNLIARKIRDYLAG